MEKKLGPIGILGRGKSARPLIELLNHQGLDLVVFNSQNKLTLEEGKKLQAIIAFIPSQALIDYLPLLLKLSLPLISGDTGKAWPPGIHEELIKNGTTWVKAHNFSLSMVAIKQAIKALSQIQEWDPQSTYTLKEIHHTHKKDAPSGTALSWKKWLGDSFLDLEIESQRMGEEVGFHQLQITGPSETIILSHKAHDRSLFAKGAYWALKKVLEGNLPPGLFYLEDLMNHP